MYEEFFGLSDSPFQLSPDPFFMFSSGKSNEALASISYAISRRKGFIVMTGEVGTGKTLVLRCLFELWEREQIPFAYFIGPRLSTVDFLSYITHELAIRVKEPTKGNMLRCLYGFLLEQFEKGRTTVLIIDEAHQMPRSVLEEIRVLANFETAQQKLIQIVLVGQPELEKKLDLVELRSLKQRVAVRCRLEPLGAEEVRRYIEHRLEVAGAGLQATTIFPVETIQAICRYSLGIPRLINSICDQSLAASYARKVRVVPVEVINEIAADFRLDRSPSSKQTEKSFSLPIPIVNSARNRSSVATSNTGVKTPDPGSTFDNLSANGGKSVQTAVSGAPVTSDASSLSNDSTANGYKLEQRTGTSKAHSLGSTSDPTPRAVLPSPIYRWLKPGLRLSSMIAVPLVPVALVTGLLMAHLTVPHQVASTRETLPAEQRSASIPVAMPTTQVEPRPLGPIAPRSGIDTPKNTDELEHLTPPVKTVMSTLSRPILNKSSNVANATDPPLVVESPTKGLDLGKDLLGISAPGPTPPSTNPVFQLEPPKLASSHPPTYPSLARTVNVGGVVVVDAGVDETGKVTDVKLISGSPLLGRAAIEAVRTWKYEPARLNGKPIAAHLMVSINLSPK